MSERGAKWLARRVHELRGERELTPAELADASGLSVAEVIAVERGEASAPLSTLRRWRAASVSSCPSYFKGWTSFVMSPPPVLESVPVGGRSG